VTWAAILATAAGCYVLKLTGLSVPTKVLDQPLVQRIADLMPVALLSALIGVQVLGEGSRLVLDARLLGFAVAVVALVLRAPFIVVVFSAALAAALVRLL
jgi:branched-subunit amino acid transport protein